MQINVYELNLILACLRHAAIEYDQQARAAAAAFKKTEAAQLAAFAAACGNLSDRLDPSRPKIIIPR